LILYELVNSSKIASLNNKKWANIGLHSLFVETTNMVNTFNRRKGWIQPASLQIFMSGLESLLSLLTAFYALFMEDFVFRSPICVVMGTFSLLHSELT
jgi:hypothetical protein